MSLWADYVREREGKEVIEGEHYFISYGIEGDYCVIGDMYVREEHREHGIGWMIFAQVISAALKKGCTYLVSTVSTADRNYARSIAIHKAGGFLELRRDGDMIVFQLELSAWVES
jgi:GNAT superfamily N-acetyltransferase